MKRFHFLMTVLMFAANAMAQPATTSSEAHDGRIQREPPRTGLRSALQTPQQASPQGEARKHLSPKERDELRQQLRQQQAETGRAKP